MPRDCPGCGDAFFPRFRKQRYCSRACGQAASPTRGLPRPEARKTLRPPYLVLLAEIERNGYLATGRKYSVSDNAIRKWVRFYENEIERRSIEAPGEHRGRRTNEAA